MSTIVDLLPTLIKKTQQRKLAWQVGDDTSVWLKIGENIIQVESYSTSRANLIKVQVRNSDGTVVDEMMSDDDDLSWDSYFSLFSMARRTALKSDEIVSDIISRLEKI